MFYLLITGFLIFGNWLTWIYAVVSNKIIDASFGYFIMPILSVFFGILFFKETRNYVQRVLEIINVYKYLLSGKPIKIHNFFEDKPHY